MIRKIMGIFFIFIGLLGCMLPVMPGLIFLFPGLAMISPSWEKRMKLSYESYQNHRRPLRLFAECWKGTRETLADFCRKIRRPVKNRTRLNS